MGAGQSTSVTVRFPAEEAEVIRRRAQEAGATYTQVLRQAVAVYASPARYEWLAARDALRERGYALLGWLILDGHLSMVQCEGGWLAPQMIARLSAVGA
jgi:hypothetical protein